MIQTFAKEYKESITLTYYCGNLLLTIVVFVFGTIYLWHKDRRDQQRCLREDREDQNRRNQEDRRDHQRRLQEDREHLNRRDQEDRRDHQRREWCQFAERIYTDYSSLRRNQILENMLKVKKTFEKFPIHSEVTGLDVLRYWLADDRHRNVWSESPQLRALREDLYMIFLQLNSCHSLIHLGEVPKNITEELRYVVEELGNVAKPFLTGEKLKVASTCLKHFGMPVKKEEEEEGGGGVGGEEEEEKKLHELVEGNIPYLDSLKFGDNDHRASSTSSPPPPVYYSQSKFLFNVSMPNNEYNFLQKLHDNLEKGEGKTFLVRMFKDRQAELPPNLTDPIGDCMRYVTISIIFRTTESYGRLMEQIQ